MMRLGYSGQYMQVNGTTAGSTVVQNRYLGKEAQMFLIHGDETGGFSWNRPMQREKHFLWLRMEHSRCR